MEEGKALAELRANKWKSLRQTTNVPIVRSFPFFFLKSRDGLLQLYGSIETRQFIGGDANQHVIVLDRIHETVKKGVQ